MSDAPFRSPEHCLRVSFAFAALNIEPRNATGRVIEILRARRGLHSDFDRVPSGLTQHDWHAQAAMALSFIERTLQPHPLLWEVVQAEYGHGLHAALALQAVCDHVASGEDGRERLLMDAVVMRHLRTYPRMRSIADRLDVAVGTVANRARQVRDKLNALQSSAVARLLTPMQEAGLVPGGA